MMPRVRWTESLLQLLLVGVLLESSRHASDAASLTGFDSRTFQFLGIADRWFSLICEKSHLVNFELSSFQHLDHADGYRNGTFISAIAFQYKSHKLRVDVNQEGDLTIVVDGNRLRMEDKQDKFITAFEGTSDVRITWELNRQFLGHAVDIKSPLFHLLIHTVPAGTQRNGMATSHLSFLNFSVKLLKQPQSTLHGVLGQTYQGFLSQTYYEKQTNRTFTGEGSVEDYLVSHDFAANSKFNTFEVLTRQRDFKGRR